MAQSQNSDDESDQFQEVEIGQDHIAAPIPVPPRTVADPGPGAPMNNGNPPPLPARDSGYPNGPPLPPRKRQPPFATPADLHSGRNRSHTVTSMSSGSVQFDPKRASFMSTANYDLLLSRVEKKDGQSTSDASIASGDANALLDTTAQLQNQFDSIHQKLQPAGFQFEPNGGPDDPSAIDWEFWQQAVADYSSLARTNPVDLSLSIASGIPSPLRGVLWQVISDSKSKSLEELYKSIVVETSPHQAAIESDLEILAIPSTVDKQALFNVIKSYSLFDPEIGYTQGMAHVILPLLHHMTEVESFCLLVKLMKDYGLRDFFLSDMPGLHLRLYQFDRMLEDTLPDIHIHLSRQGVRSSMYTTQWFLTMFAYKFPLSVVDRIYDVVLSEGIESLLKFAVGLVRRNSATILSLDFGDLLQFLKESVFDFYVYTDEASGEVQYRINDFIADAYEVKVLPTSLKKYINEYSELHRADNEKRLEVEELRNTNSSLSARLRMLDATITSLTSEHVVVANDLVHERDKTAVLEGTNSDLIITKTALESELDERQGLLGENPAQEVCIFLALWLEEK